MAGNPKKAPTARGMADLPLHAVIKTPAWALTTHALVGLAMWFLIAALAFCVWSYFAHGAECRLPWCIEGKTVVQALRAGDTIAEAVCTTPGSAIVLRCSGPALRSNDPRVNSGVFTPDTPHKPENTAGAKPWQNWNGALLGDRK